MAGDKALVYESIIRDMAEGMMTIDLNGTVDSFNPAAERILGRKRDEVVGNHFARMFMEDPENDIFTQTVLDAMYEPMARHEKVVPWHHGDQIKQLYLVSSFLFHEGREVGTIIVFNDITELTELKLRYARDIELLLDSLVKALSAAIDERSHYNANHTRNMVKMAEAFMDWMESNGNPWGYDEVRRQVFIMSVGLHDVGKLTVPLEIMDKATRLGPRLEIIRERFVKLNLLYRIAMLEGRISADQYHQSIAEAEETLAFICRVNAVGFLPDDDFQRVQNLASKTFTDENGTIRRLLEDQEITMLSIRKGTLTAHERSLMQEHATSTWNILNQVHFPEEFASVPVWAASHHELLNASGYTKGLSGKEIPREVRLLTILDIFEALTAKDRPYKPAIPLEKAWSILDNMVQEGALDGKMLAEFRKSMAWEQIVENHPDPES